MASAIFLTKSSPFPSALTGPYETRSKISDSQLWSTWRLTHSSRRRPWGLKSSPGTWSRRRIPRKRSAESTNPERPSRGATYLHDVRQSRTATQFEIGSYQGSL